MSELTIFYSLLMAYLIGSLPSAIIVSRLFGLPDPRSYGSNNPGATNVLRSGNKKAAILTLTLDIVKGGAAVWCVVQVLGGIAAVAVLGAVLGHVYSFWLRFKGGKGVATAIGAIAIYAPWLALMTLTVFIVILGLSRYVSLSSSIAATTIPLWLWVGQNIMGFPKVSTLDLTCMILLSLLVILRHRQNLYRLYQGQEARLKKKSI